MKKILHIIPHSHWDREWYLPFEKHRIRLIDLFDRLIEVMEENEDYTYYHMDGQYIVIDDYLEIRPQMRERLLKLIRAGRIQIGPWYILQDEYLTSGEANVRNMLYGIRLCRALGVEPVPMGYLPDAFGNIAQMPQIIRGFGYHYAVFGRGLAEIGFDNSVVEGGEMFNSELIWRSPDGSDVISVLMVHWYNNATELPSDPAALKERISLIGSRAADCALTDHLLGMNGCDHQPIQMNLHKVIKLANEVQDEFEVRQSNFVDYLDEISKYADRYSVYEGEINGQFTKGTCPLTSTASSHVDIKQDNYLTQNLLERISEPVSLVSMLNGGKYKQDFMLYAWKTLMQNHPHDSICTCSCDEVYSEMKTRFAKAIACAQELRDGSCDYLATVVDTSAIDGEKALVVLSLEPGHTNTVVKTHVDFELNDDVSEIAIFDENGNAVPAKTKLLKKHFTYTLPEDRFRQPKYVNRFEIEMPLDVQGIGYRVYSVKKQAPTVQTSIRYTDRAMENEFLAVRFNDNGTIDVTNKKSGRVYAGQNLIEDAKDRGDLYNYFPVDGHTPVTNKHLKADISLFEVTSYSVTFKADIPLPIDADITTYVTLRDGLARVDIRTVVTNRAEDHRIRALFAADIDAERVLAEGQFSVTRREIVPSETWINPSYMQRSDTFVGLESDTTDQAFLVAHRGLNEYEVLRDGHNTLALTLLRSIGQIGDWGVFPTPLGQKKGTYTLEYSFVPYEKQDQACAFGLAYTFHSDAVLAIGTDKHTGTAPVAMDYLRFDNEYIRLSAFKKAEDSDHVIARFFNADNKRTVLNVTVAPIFTKARLTDLGEKPIEEVAIRDGVITLDVGACKIVTLELF